MSKQKITCEIIKDLVPSYVDDILSKESKELVKDHVENCKECQKMLESMEVDLAAGEDEDVTLFKKVSKGFRKMYFLKAFLAVLIFLIVWLVASFYVIETYHPIWPKSSVEGLQTYLKVVEINGEYYVHQTDMYAMGDVCVLDYDFSETGIYNFYLGEQGIHTIMPGVRSYYTSEKYQHLCQVDGVKKINYCKPDGTVIVTLWEEGDEIQSFVQE